MSKKYKTIPTTRPKQNYHKNARDLFQEQLDQRLKELKRQRKQNEDSTMGSVLKVVKRAGSLIGGIITGGGSLFAGVDITTALLIGGGTIALILGVEVATIKEFKELFEEKEK